MVMSCYSWILTVTLFLFMKHLSATAYVVNSRVVSLRRDHPLTTEPFRCRMGTTYVALHGTKTSNDEEKNESIKKELLHLISLTPSNSVTSKEATYEILATVRELESRCLTPEAEVLSKLSGNWELLWTAQDKSSPEWNMGPLRTWINPLENQSYSNNPSGTGRSNPILPRQIEDRLENMGIISRDTDPVRSSQYIDMKHRQVRNVVTFNVPSMEDAQKLVITVTVDFTPNKRDRRRVDVKFQACRIVISNSPIDFTIPLGFVGPTGWLRTSYISSDLRITRGHKGSVFVLCRTSQRRNQAQ